MGQPKIDTVLQRLLTLSESVQVMNVSLDSFRCDIREVKKDVKDLNVKVGIQNGSVKDLKDDRNTHAEIIAKIVAAQAACPGVAVAKEYHKDKETNANNPIVIVINHWKTIGAIVAIAVVAIIFIPPLYEWITSLIRDIDVEIGY